MVKNYLNKLLIILAIAFLFFAKPVFAEEGFSQLFVKVTDATRAVEQGDQAKAKKLVDEIKEGFEQLENHDSPAGKEVSIISGVTSTVATSKITGEEEIYSHTDLYDFRANIEGAEKIFQLFKPLIKNKDEKLVASLEKEFKNVNSLLDKHMTDSQHYKLYTDLTKEDTKELAEAVTKLGEPLSQMGVILNGK